MSIQDVINQHDGTELHCVESLWYGEETPRYIFVSNEVMDLVSQQGDSHEAKLGQNAKALLDDFVEGGEITMGLNPYDKEASCILARVDAGSEADEYDIWDFRCLDPRPGVRVLGGFADKDVFVAITWDFRENFDQEWPERIRECVSEWRRLFGHLLPFKGRKPDDYVSPPVRAC